MGLNGAPEEQNQQKRCAAYQGEKPPKAVEKTATHQLSMTLRKQQAVLEVVESNHQCAEAPPPEVCKPVTMSPDPNVRRSVDKHGG